MSMGHENPPASCPDPIDAAVLADYWLAALSDSEEEAVEEHLFACDECGTRLREVMALAEGVRDVARAGSLRMIASDAYLQRMQQEGLQVRQYAPPTGGSVQCTVTSEDDILIGRLAANLNDVGRLDLTMCYEHGVEQLRMRDIPVHPEASSVIYQESIAFAKAAPTRKFIARLVTVDEAGGERLLGEYTFKHTRSLPGPGVR